MGSELDTRDQPDRADVDHVGQVPEAEQCFLPVGLQVDGLLEQVLLLIDLLGRQCRCAGHRMPGVGVAVEELDDAFRSLHERIEQVVGDQHRAHGNRAVGQALGAGEDVRRHVPALGGEGFADTAEAGDDLIEDQQNAVFGSDLTQPLQIANWRQDHPGRAGHWLDDHRGDVLRTMQRHQPLQLIGALHAMLRQALAEGVALQIEGVRQVIDARQHRAEGAAVVGHAAHRHAAETDAVIGQLAADQPRTRALTDGALIGQGDLQRGIRRLRSGVGEEHPIQSFGADGGEFLGQLER